MHVIIAVPCLNERDTFLPTCASLGFKRDQSAPADTLLILVDNGSDDDTWAHMQALEAALPGAVSAVREPVRGYIAARRKGASEAVGLAEKRGWPFDDVLLLQADADTIYAPGYIEAMRRCAEATPPNRLYEGRSEAPADPTDPIARMQAAEQAADAGVADQFATDALDVIVDDKVAAFRLSDYIAWGGHQQEFDRAGEEILAETTRLYMRARLGGAQRVRVDDAEARTSTRRIMEAPDIAFATAGFPYPSAWKDRWQARYRGPQALDAFTAWPLPGSARQVVDERRRHVLALFRDVPKLQEVAHRRSEAGDTPAAPGAILQEAFAWHEQECDQPSKGTLKDV